MSPPALCLWYLHISALQHCLALPKIRAALQKSLINLFINLTLVKVGTYLDTSLDNSIYRNFSKVCIYLNLYFVSTNTCLEITSFYECLLISSAPAGTQILVLSPAKPFLVLFLVFPKHLEKMLSGCCFMHRNKSAKNKRAAGQCRVVSQRNALSTQTSWSSFTKMHFHPHKNLSMCLPSSVSV